MEPHKNQIKIPIAGDTDRSKLTLQTTINNAFLVYEGEYFKVLEVLQNQNIRESDILKYEYIIGLAEPYETCKRLFNSTLNKHMDLYEVEITYL